MKRTAPHSSALACLAALALGLLVTLPVGCDKKDQLTDREERDIVRFVQTGIEARDDPFPRVETLRVLETYMRAERFERFALDALEDDSAMVRVAALRALLAFEHDETDRKALVLYNDAGPRERREILRAILERGAKPLQRELLARSLRDEDRALQKFALVHGPIQAIEEAREAGKTTYVEEMLVPELGSYVDLDKFPHLAPRALQALVEFGEPKRARPILAALEDDSQPIGRRVLAARTLARARVKAARPLFETIVEEGIVRDEDREKLELPKARIDPRLLRYALLGLAAIGDTSVMRQAKAYLEHASGRDAVEVLELISTNPSDEALISIKVAMQDARPEVRRRAIELYGHREDASVTPLIGVLRRSDHYPTRVAVARQLKRPRFREAWQKTLRRELAAPDLAADSLELLRDVLVEPDERRIFLEPLEPRLEELASSSDAERTAELASFLLIQISEITPALAERLRTSDDLRTRYAYLETLVRDAPRQHVAEFRRFFYDDLYAFRLLSAAGLWRAFRGGAPDAQSTAPDAQKGGDEEPSDESETTGAGEESAEKREE